MKEKIVKLDNDRTVKVKELRFKDAIKVASNFEELFSDFSVKDLVGEKFEIFKDLISGIVEFPEGEELEDLYFSELEKVLNAFKDVNESFLGLIKYVGLGGQETISTPSTEQPPD